MSSPRNYEVLTMTGGTPIKAWIRGVPLEEPAERQLRNVASLPFVHKWVAVMPDVHYGIGATVGSVIPTVAAIIPAAVGVDIGCGMMAVQTSLHAGDLPESLTYARAAVEQAVPHGLTRRPDKGSWGEPPPPAVQAWANFEPRFRAIVAKHPKIERSNHVVHLGTLGTGNHFIEICLDEADRVWFMLHSGSRGVGNRIGSYFIELAREDIRKWFINLPDEDLAYLPEGTDHFNDYVEAVGWAQAFAMTNRRLMMRAVIEAVRSVRGIPPFEAELTAVNCHHNYVARERHYGKDVFVTRKGAVRAGGGGLGAGHVARRGQETLHRRRPHQGHGGDRVPEGRGRDRRDARRLQGHRRGDGGPEGSRRDRPHAPPGRLREGVKMASPEGSSVRG